MYIFHDGDTLPPRDLVPRVSHATDPRIPREWLEKAAYYHWVKRGRPHGSSWTDWLEAEKELKGRLMVAPPKPGTSQPSSKTEEPPHSWLA
jgi:hypothetical protein